MPSMGRMLQQLREEVRLSQSEVAKRLPFTASTLSRLESDELGLTRDQAQEIARAIGTQRALAYAEYLDQEWNCLEAPGFYHPSRQVLWDAEKALQRLQQLKDDPDLRNAFIKQVESCRDALSRTAAFLLSTQHPVAFLGSPGVGKTTVVCSLAGLRDPSEEDLDRQMMLPTGGGRVTICEVHVRGGGEYALSVDPCSEEEMPQYIAEFCDYLLSITGSAENGGKEGVGLNAELDRALRNLTGLQVKRAKGADGRVHQEDPAKDLAVRFPSREDLEAEIFSRLDLLRRRRTSISYRGDSSMTGLQWVSRTFTAINYGRHPEFSLPRRIEVTLPEPVLGETSLDIHLIDTRGVDEPQSPRRDLQSHLDDDRAIVVFCSSFKDAPDAAMQGVIMRAKDGGLWESFRRRPVILLLPQDGEEARVRDHSGEPVANAAEGRDVRQDQVAVTLRRLGVAGIPVEFLDVRKLEDSERLRDTLVRMVLAVRHHAEKKIETLVDSVERLIANKANEQVRAVFEAATRRICVWIDANADIPQREVRIERSLLRNMDSLRYASSLRASVNRRGSWYNFDYWHGLGYGSRREAVARTEKQVNDLKAVLENLLDDPDLAEAHAFLKHLRTQVEEAMNSYYLEVQAVGETAFSDQLLGDDAYWAQCRDRWGKGRGYKADIRNWTEEWFTGTLRQERDRFIDMEMQRRWREMLGRLRAQVESGRQVGAAA